MSVHTSPNPTTPTSASRSPRLWSASSAEWAKLSNLRAPGRLIGTAVAAAATAAAVFILSFPVTQGTPLEQARLTDVLTASVLGLDVAAIILVVFAAWFVGVEFRTGAITEALLRVPRRSSMLAAKAIVITAVTVLTAVLAAFALTVVAIGLAASFTGASWSQALTAAVSHEHLRLLLGSALMPVVFALFAVFATFVFASMAAGVLGALSVIVASLLAGWLPTGAAAGVRPVLPLAAVHTISGAAGTGSTEYLGVVPALIVLVAWVAVGWGLAAWRLHRRDF